MKLSAKMCTSIFQQPFSFMPTCGMSPELARVKSDHWIRKDLNENGFFVQNFSFSSFFGKCNKVVTFV